MQSTPNFLGAVAVLSLIGMLACAQGTGPAAAAMALAFGMSFLAAVTLMGDKRRG